MAERLDFTSDTTTPYNSMIAAEHMIRYAIASKFCTGKKVLDIACGEGYGTAYMLDNGAANVLGVDNSQEAISRAEKKFSRDGVKFICSDAMDVAHWNPTGEKFDVIVCFETIEHLESPQTLLAIFRDCIATDGIILISCPNDLIEQEQNITNSFHTRVYSFEDFRNLTTQVLGEPSQWAFGSPVTGVSVYDDTSDLIGTKDNSMMQMLCTQQANTALLLPAQYSHKVNDSGAAFYLGIWNGSIDNAIVAAPMSRQSYLEYYFSNISYKERNEEISLRCSEQQKMVSTLEKRLSAAQRIYAFETDRLNNQNAQLHNQILELNSSLNTYAFSRAHRLAALYTRTAIGRSPIHRAIAFGFAASASALRAIKRRF